MTTKLLVLITVALCFPLVIAQQKTLSKKITSKSQLSKDSIKKVWEQPIKAKNYYFVGFNNGAICRNRDNVGFNPVMNFYAEKDYHLEVWQKQVTERSIKKYKDDKQDVDKIKSSPYVYTFELRIFRISKYGTRVEQPFRITEGSFSMQKRINVITQRKGEPVFIKKLQYNPTLKPQTITDVTGSVIPFGKLMKEVYAIHIYNSTNKAAITTLPISKLFIGFKLKFPKLED